LSPYASTAQDLTRVLSPPSWTHWAGTDQLGRDVLTRTLEGGRVSLLAGLCATAVALAIGVGYGAWSGFAGGRTDMVMMRAVEVLYALPFVVFVILLMVVFGRHFALLFVAIGAVGWLTMARIVRGQVLSLKQRDYVTAAAALGASRRRVVARHILPNLIGPVVVYATLAIPNAMLLEAFISFLGLGVHPPMSSWGVLIQEGAGRMEESPWLLIVPGGLFAATLFALNTIGDGLRDAIDPKAQEPRT
jgi:oligopeptide transport system permease protein